MKKILIALSTLLLSLTTQSLSAQVIAFSMATEEASKNTPNGWTAVNLPTGLPEFTAANTFYINAAPYSATTSSEDNTAAIQAALDAAANAGGGMVVVPAGTWLTGCLTMGSKTVLHLCEGATLKMLDYSTFPTDGNGYAKMENPFITGKSGASDIVIEGESRTTSIIDGQGAPWWDNVETAKAASKSTTRSAMIRFWQGSRYLFRNFRIQNTPNTNITIGRSGNGSHATVHDITIKNPASDAADPSHNTDGIPIWTQYVNIYDCEIDTGDDNIVCDQDAQYVHVWNCDFLAGHGASFGSYTTNMHHIIYEDLTLTGTEAGFRLKSNRDRSGDVHDIIFRNCTMTNVPSPISITSWYDTLPTPEDVAASPDEKISTTPEFHDILIQNVTVSGHTTYNGGAGKNYYGIFIYGRPESKVHDVVFDNVNITHSKGLKLNFCEDITFYDNCSYTVSNTNNTSKNGTATAVTNGLDNLIEQKYQGAYTWNVPKPGAPRKAILSWQMGTNGANATAANSITGASGSAAEGFTITITGNNTKNWTAGGGSITYNSTSYKTLKNSNGAQNTVTLPTGMYAHKVEFYAVTNDNSSNGVLNEFNGNSCSDALNSLNDYPHPTYIAKEFTTGVNSFTFTFGTKQVCFIAVVTYSDSETLEPASNPDPDPEPAPGSYTNTWQFGKQNGAETFALQSSPEYTYTVDSHDIIINTDAGKLNNANRSDQWAQCNNGTTFKIPVFEGAKITWGRYTSGSTAGFTVNGQLYNDYYIATAADAASSPLSISATGISYLSHITVEPVTMYAVTGTITGSDINGKSFIMTARSNGEPHSATVAENAFTLNVPADTYDLSLSDDAPFVISSPDDVIVSTSGSVGAIIIVPATAQTVTGAITNAPAEAFTLTFTGGSHTETVNCAAGATSFSTALSPDTYVISSNVGTLSPLSIESFKVVKDAVSHNIYFPEAASPNATQNEIIVDNTIMTETANNYKSVTNALAAAKAGNISNPVITLTSGQTYREQVIVDQANITLKTSGTEKATITFYYGIGYAYYSLNANGYYDKDRAMTRNSILMIDPARWGCTVKVTNKGTNFKAENIIFENSFNQYYTDEEVIDGVRPNGIQSITYDRTIAEGASGYKAADSKTATERAAAIAIENNPTGVELYNCVFNSSQDTFYSSGKVFVKNCNIIGNTDYIFGGGYVVFDDCDLTIGGYSDQNATAYITAYKDGNTLDADKKYVFRDCTVKSYGRAYTAANLGRDWGGAAASVYYFNLKNEIDDKLSYSWSNMGGGVTAGTANLHVYDFDPTINANYNTTGSAGANINGVLSNDDATTLYTEVVSKLGFTPAHLYDIQLDEANNHNAIKIKAANGHAGDITLNRSIKAGNWSTLVLPFDMTEGQVKATYGNDVKLAAFDNYDTGTKVLSMTQATSISANVPCFIKVSSAIDEDKVIEGVTIAEDTTPEAVISGDFKLVGVYGATEMGVGDYFLANNQLYKATANSQDIKPFRAYFTGAPVGARLSFFDDEDVTGVNDVRGNKEDVRDEFFDLQGRKIENPSKGLYIVNGKKVIMK